MMEQGAAPAGSASSAGHPGGAGAPPGDTKWSPARSWLTPRLKYLGEKAGPAAGRRTPRWRAGRRHALLETSACT